MSSQNIIYNQAEFAVTPVGQQPYYIQPQTVQVAPQAPQVETPQVM